MSDPWDRQPGETSKSYAAFARYLGLGPHRTVARMFAPKAVPGYAGAWSARHHWIERAAAYDASRCEASLRKAAAIRDQLFEEFSRFTRKAINAMIELMDDKDPRIRLRACTDYLDRMGIVLTPSASSSTFAVAPPEIPDDASPAKRDEILRAWCASGTPDRLVVLERLARDPSLPATKRADLIELLCSYGGLAVPRRVDLPQPEPEVRKREMSAEEELAEFKRLGYVQ